MNQRSISTAGEETTQRGNELPAEKTAGTEGRGLIGK